MTPANQLPDFCGCNRDWVFRHVRYTADGKTPINGKTVCYTCGRNMLMDYSFMEARNGVWKHESYGNGTWPIPDNVIAELERGDAERETRRNNDGR